MKPISSPLKIIDFAITRMEYDFVPLEKPAAIITFFDQYDLDIDFTIYKTEFLQIVMTAEINMSEKPLPGYKILTEVAALFKLDYSQSITEEEKRSVEGFSSVYMALNSLRTLVSSFTANAPFGRYILPSIDLNDLIKKKQESVQAERKQETIKPRKNEKIKKIK